MGDTGLNLGGNKKTAFAIKEVTVECGRKINVAMIHHIQLIFEQHELEHADPLLCLFFYNNKYYSTIQSVVGLIPRCWTLRPEEPWVWRPTISYTWIHSIGTPDPHVVQLCSRDCVRLCGRKVKFSASKLQYLHPKSSSATSWLWDLRQDSTSPGLHFLNS